jgi:hypothetical protein
MQEPDTGRNENTMPDDATTSETTTTLDSPNPNGRSPGGSPKAKANPKVKPKRTPTTASAVKKATSGHRPKVRRPFPQNTLEEALIIPQAIKEKNKGKPLELVAKACNNLSHTSTKFFYLAASSRDYGLTTGSRDTETISLTDLGNSIVYPESAEQQRQGKINAFFSVKLFKDVFEHYGGGTLPEKEFVSSILVKKVGLDESLHEEFCDLYQKNCKYLSLTDARSALQVVKRESQGADEAVVLGQPGEYSHHAFIIMLFSEKGKEARPAGFFDEVLNSLIKPACNAARLRRSDGP